MDIFCEQLVAIKNGAARYLLFALLLIAAAALCIILFICSLEYAFLIFLIVGVIYGTIKLAELFFIEYEYIITNDTVDIDKIIAKKRRKRIVSFETKDILRTAAPGDTGVAKTVDKVFYCADKSENACFIVAKKGNAKIAVFIEAGEKFKKAVTESAPKSIKRDLFV